MKDQYVGDIGDFEKYSVLQELGRSCGLTLVVCWMLTAPDTTGDGAKVEYLTKPERYRHLNPYVFDRLATIVRSDQRSTRAVEEVDLLEGAQFVRRRLEDDVASRNAMFHELWEVAGVVPSLVFFDPDIGLEVKSIRKGRKRSAMYLYRDELAGAFNRGHSLVVYQHFARAPRAAFLASTFASLREVCEPQRLFALWSPRVAFIVVPQQDVAASLRSAAREFASRWTPSLTFTDEDDFVAVRGDAVTTTNEICFVVPGYPPTKNEAKSLLSDSHIHFDRVRLLLERAGEALARGAKPFGADRLGLELVIHGPADSPSDATNYLGGIGDVLQDKSRRGSLEHLGALAAVQLFTDDGQIREVSYREERAQEPKYQVRIWRLDDDRA